MKEQGTHHPIQDEADSLIDEVELSSLEKSLNGVCFEGGEGFDLRHGARKSLCDPSTAD